MIGQFYEVDEIMGRRKRKNKYEYLIKWKGYSINESTWEPEEKLFTIRDLIEEYDLICDNKEKKKKKKKKNDIKSKEILINEKFKETDNDIEIKEEEKEDKKESNNKKPYFLLDNSIDKILGIKLEKNELIGIIERKDKDGKVFTEKISTEDIKKTNPWILVDYYESLITFE